MLIIKYKTNKIRNYLPSEIKFEILEEFREDLLIAYRKSVNYN